jgi:hypothetical protein
MSAKQKASFRPTLDVLEDRCLLAAGLGHGLHLGHLAHSNNGLHLGKGHGLNGHHGHHGLHLGKGHGHNHGHHNGQ